MKKPTKKTKKVKAPKAVKAKAKPAETTRGNPEGSPFAYCRELIINQKHSDEEILTAVTKRFPDAVFNQGYISSERWTLNQALSAGKKLARLARGEGGKLVPKSSLPKKTGSKKKFTEENDPLVKKAGINVHLKKAATPKAAKPKAVTV